MPFVHIYIYTNQYLDLMDTKRCGGWRFTLQTNSVGSHGIIRITILIILIIPCGKHGDVALEATLHQCLFVQFFLPAVWYEIETANRRN